MASLSIRTEWEEAEGVASPALAATWARIEIIAAGRPVTQYLSLPARTVRTAVYGSVLPLARFVARSFWNLLSEGLPQTDVLRGGRASAPARRDWLERHNVLFSREGMAYPDLAIYR